MTTSEQRKQSARQVFTMMAGDSAFVASMIAHALMEWVGASGMLDDIGFEERGIGQPVVLRLDVCGEMYRITIDHVNAS